MNYFDSLPVEIQRKIEIMRPTHPVSKIVINAFNTDFKQWQDRILNYFFMGFYYYPENQSQRPYTMINPLSYDDLKLLEKIHRISDVVYDEQELEGGGHLYIEQVPFLELNEDEMTEYNRLLKKVLTYEDYLLSSNKI